MNNYNFLQRQHPVLKLIFAAVSLIFTGFVEIYTLLFALCFNLVLFSFKQQYLIAWLKAIAKISPLFISILISGFIFSLPFPEQIALCLRIAFLLSVSLYAFITIPGKFLATMICKHPHGFSHDIARFLWKTSQLIPFFFSSFKSSYKKHKPDFIRAIVDSFTSAHSTIHEEIIIPETNVVIPPIFSWTNLLLCLIITAETGLIIRSFL